MTHTLNPAAALEADLHRLVPISAAMGVRVVHLATTAIELSAPLAANRNHVGSGFAGSLYALACLTGWGYLHYTVQEAGLAATLVLAQAEVRYRRPLTGELRAVLEVAPELRRDLLARLGNAHRARATLTILLPGRDNPAAIVEGSFVALPDDGAT